LKRVSGTTHRVGKATGGRAGSPAPGPPSLRALLVTATAALLVAMATWASPVLAWTAEEAPAPATADSTLRTPAPADTAAIPPPAPPDSAAVPSPAPPAPGGAIIHSVVARGFVTTDSLVVLRTFGLRAGDPFDPAAVKAGVRRLYGTGLFTDVNVEDSPEEGGMRLVVVVAERPRVRGIRFAGVKKVEESKLREKLTVTDGQLLDTGTLALDARKMEEYYTGEGFPAPM
jgi:hypothetical protein